MKKSIIHFIQSLKQKKENALIYNQYYNSKQRQNLREYLFYLSKHKPEYLLLGEAGGYLGCKHSRIAFTSGFHLKYDVLFSPLRNELNFKGISKFKERSATIVYALFHEKPETFTNVVLFNAFPFHPHLKNDLNTNRKPKKSELEDCQIYLKELMALFPFKKVLLIGKVAGEFFEEFEENHLLPPLKKFQIRHPSYGGKPKFIKKMRKILKIKYKKQMKLDSWQNGN